MPIESDFNVGYQPSKFDIPKTHLTFDINSVEGVTVTSEALIVRKDGVADEEKLVLNADTGFFEIAEIWLNGERLEEGIDYEVYGSFAVAPSDSAEVAEAKHAMKDKEHTVEFSGLPSGELNFKFVTKLNPKTNDSGCGLYLSDPEHGTLSTHGEPTGFRQITLSLDRPDVRTVYSTTLVAPKREFPVLMANGNPVAKGTVTDDDSRHFSHWENPHAMPSYLFAMAAGDLRCLEDRYVSDTGRVVELRAYASRDKAVNAEHAINVLKGALGFYERRFGMVYDLDHYNILAVPRFNAGAMENKGLNIFTENAMLASKTLSSDGIFEWVTHVVAHELAHDHFGDNIGIEDWRYIFLKEGAATMFEILYANETNIVDPVLERINSVSTLRTRQFAEEYGPSGHALVIEGAKAPDNYYTLTSYYKGKELLQTLMELLGVETWVAGMRVYFERHMGSAVGLKEFLESMEAASGRDLNQFALWYTQAGTPEVHCHTEYDEEAQVYTITLRQSTPLTVAQKAKADFEPQPYHIPVKVALFNRATGEHMPLRLVADGAGVGAGAGAGAGVTVGAEVAANEMVLELTAVEQSFKFIATSEPVPSLFRNFSAPIRLNHPEQSVEDMMFLAVHDSDKFNRWDVAHNLLMDEVVRLYLELKAGADIASLVLDPRLLDAHRRILADESITPGFKSVLLGLPSFNEVKEEIKHRLGSVDLDVVFELRKHLREVYTAELGAPFHTTYAAIKGVDVYEVTKDLVENRSLKNLSLTVAALQATTDVSSLEAIEGMINAHYNSRNITLVQAAVRASISFASSNPEYPEAAALRDRLLADYYEKYAVVDSDLYSNWLAYQTLGTDPDCHDRVRELVFDSGKVDLTNQTHAYKVLRNFANNHEVFHRNDGSGYALIADAVLKLDDFNVQMSSGMAKIISYWQGLDDMRVRLMVEQNARIYCSRPSTQLKEVVDNMLINAPLDVSLQAISRVSEEAAIAFIGEVLDGDRLPRDKELEALATMGQDKASLPFSVQLELVKRNTELVANAMESAARVAAAVAVETHTVGVDAAREFLQSFSMTTGDGGGSTELDSGTGVGVGAGAAVSSVAATDGSVGSHDSSVQVSVDEVHLIADDDGDNSVGSSELTPRVRA